MQTDDLILAEEFCAHYDTQFSFINYLNQFGLINITTIEETYYIPQSELPRLEQLVRLHTDLNINPEGLDAITHLLDKVRDLQSEIAVLKNKLSLYEKV